MRCRVLLVVGLSALVLSSLPGLRAQEVCTGIHHLVVPAAPTARFGAPPGVEIAQRLELPPTASFLLEGIAWRVAPASETPLGVIPAGRVRVYRGGATLPLGAPIATGSFDRENRTTTADWYTVPIPPLAVSAGDRLWLSFTATRPGLALDMDVYDPVSPLAVALLPGLFGARPAGATLRVRLLSRDCGVLAPARVDVVGVGAGAHGRKPTLRPRAGARPRIGLGGFALQGAGGPPLARAYLWVAWNVMEDAVDIVPGRPLHLEPSSFLAAAGAGLNPVGWDYTDREGEVTFPLAIPLDPALVGLEFAMQASFHAVFEPHRLEVTNALELRVGY